MGRTFEFKGKTYTTNETTRGTAIYSNDALLGYRMYHFQKFNGIELLKENSKKDLRRMVLELEDENYKLRTILNVHQS